MRLSTQKKVFHTKRECVENFLSSDLFAGRGEREEHRDGEQRPGQKPRAHSPALFGERADGHKRVIHGVHRGQKRSQHGQNRPVSRAEAGEKERGAHDDGDAAPAVERVQQAHGRCFFLGGARLDDGADEHLDQPAADGVAQHGREKPEERVAHHIRQNRRAGKPRAIPGHNLTALALGVFILWFCWFGFNGASTVSLTGDDTMVSASLIFMNTNMAAAVATCATMIFTWIRYKKPDVSMTFNGTLAGLVAITAGCDAVSPVGAFFIGLAAGILVVLSVEFFDKVAKIDDPVGAVAVHFANGIWGTIATGLFVNKTLSGGEYGGLVYGEWGLFGVQMLGMVAILAWTGILITGVFFLIKYVPVWMGAIKDGNGLRCAEEHEISGLDISEHGLASAYADFLPSAPSYGETGEHVDVSDVKPIPVSGAEGEKYTKITVICNQDKLATLRDTMADIGVQGMTVTPVMGCGVQKGHTAQYRGVRSAVNLMPKVQVDIVVSVVDPGLVVAAAQKALNTGNVGDGKIFVSSVEDVMRVRTGERGVAALDNEVK